MTQTDDNAASSMRKSGRFSQVNAWCCILAVALTFASGFGTRIVRDRLDVSVAAIPDAGSYVVAERAQENLARFQESYAESAALFAEHFDDGLVGVRIYEIPKYRYLLRREDRVRSILNQRARRISKIFEVSGVDLRGEGNVGHTMLSDRSVVLSDWVQRFNYSSEMQAGADAYFDGVDPASITQAQKDDFRRPYPLPVITLHCRVRHDGEVVLASSLPAGAGLDLRNVPGAEPLVEICARFANDDAAPDAPSREEAEDLARARGLFSKEIPINETHNVD